MALRNYLKRINDATVFPTFFLILVQIFEDVFPIYPFLAVFMYIFGPKNKNLYHSYINRQVRHRHQSFQQFAGQIPDHMVGATHI
jgi:hypothetical protein